MANYSIADVEGIGATYAKKLAAAGIRTTNALLKAGATKKGRKELEEKTKIGHELILKWVNMADLYRVKGVGSEYSELLEKAGVDTVKELRNRNAENLTAKMADVNSSGRALVRQLPGLKRVNSWIKEAKKLKPKVTY
jgi:predicted flap endonuclease-1-like 5' DNA nuclease